MADLLDRLPPSRKREALTHRSWAGPRRPSYERLEFLGDAVLALEVTEELMRRHPRANEGQLTAMRQRVVSGAACARAAQDSGLGERMVEESPQRSRQVARELAEKERVLAALAEATIGGGWTDLGRAETAPALLAAFSPELESADPSHRDPKSALQEEAARVGETVEYEQLPPDGPPHDRTFIAIARLNASERGRGQGRSKQAAEQAAAEAALRDMGAI